VGCIVESAIISLRPGDSPAFDIVADPSNVATAPLLTLFRAAR